MTLLFLVHFPTVSMAQMSVKRAKREFRRQHATATRRLKPGGGKKGKNGGKLRDRHARRKAGKQGNGCCATLALAMLALLGGDTQPTARQNFAERFFSERTHCIAQPWPGSSFLRSALRNV